MSLVVDNTRIDKYREPELENDHQQPVKPFPEHIVLLTIIVLSFLNGITTTMSGQKITDSKILDDQSYSLCYTAGVLPGAIMVAFISDVYGRKPFFILLAAISTITSLCLVSSNTALTLIGFSIHAVARGGAQTVFYLTVNEYSNPKHRFTYVIACISMSSIGSAALKILNTYVLPVDSVYMQVFMIVLGLACLGSTCVWPESPYWLAVRSRREEAACSLRRLRGARAEPELSQLQHERRSPGPARLYWRPLLLVLILATISTFHSLQDIAKYLYVLSMRGATMDSEVRNPHTLSGATIVGLTLMTILSYFVKRKTLYISCCGVSIVLNYVIGFWICSGILMRNDRAFPIIVFISDIVGSCAPICLNVILSSEIVPYKYNTQISCIHFVYMTVISDLLMLVFVINMTKYVYIIIFLVATLTVVGVILVLWLAPETKDRTLFEIQKSQAPQYTVTCPEQNETMMENIHR